MTCTTGSLVNIFVTNVIRQVICVPLRPLWFI